MWFYMKKTLLAEGDRDQMIMSLQEGEPVLESFQMRWCSRKVCLSRGMSHTALRFVTRLACSSGKHALCSELWQQLIKHSLSLIRNTFGLMHYFIPFHENLHWRSPPFPLPVEIFQLCYCCNLCVSKASCCSAKSIKLELLPPSSVCSWIDQVVDVPEQSKAWQLKTCSLTSVPEAHKSEVILGLCRADLVFRLGENVFFILASIFHSWLCPTCAMLIDDSVLSGVNVIFTLALSACCQRQGPLHQVMDVDQVMVKRFLTGDRQNGLA